MKLLHKLRFNRSCCRIGRAARGRRRRHPNKCNSAIDTFAPEYDLDGNQTKILTSTGIWNVEYNAQNRPIRWTQDDTVITMGYDRMGRRVFYKEMNGSTQVTYTCFLYNGYLCIQQLFSNSPWNVYKEFIWDPTEPMATRPLVFRQNGQTSTFLMHDGNKNVTDVVTVAPNNEVVGRYEYAPFGAITAQTGTRASANPFRFSSEFHDDTLGLVYYNYRHYNPKDGRWCGRDFIKNGGNGLAFCQNNPCRFDVLGLFGETGHAHSSILQVNGEEQPNYNEEDKGWAAPWNPFSTWLHFRNIKDSERDLANAVFNCDMKKYQAYAHQMQDYYAHGGQGGRWWALGHIPDSILQYLISHATFGYVTPAKMDDIEHFSRAHKQMIERTNVWVKQWNFNCCYCDGKWVRRPGGFNDVETIIANVGPAPIAEPPSEWMIPNIVPRIGPSNAWDLSDWTTDFVDWTKDLIAQGILFPGLTADPTSSNFDWQNSMNTGVILHITF